MKTSERVLEEVLTIRARLRSRIINDLIGRDLCQDLCRQGQDSRRDTAQGCQRKGHPPVIRFFRPSHLCVACTGIPRAGAAPLTCLR